MVVVCRAGETLGAGFGVMTCDWAATLTGPHFVIRAHRTHDCQCIQNLQIIKHLLVHVILLDVEYAGVDYSPWISACLISIIPPEAHTADVSSQAVVPFQDHRPLSTMPNSGDTRQQLPGNMVPRVHKIHGQTVASTITVLDYIP